MNMAYFTSTGDAILFQTSSCVVTICIPMNSCIHFTLVAMKRKPSGIEMTGIIISWHFKWCFLKANHDQSFLLLLQTLWSFTYLLVPLSQATTRKVLFDHLKTHILSSWATCFCQYPSLLCKANFNALSYTSFYHDFFPWF